MKRKKHLKACHYHRLPVGNNRNNQCIAIPLEMVELEKNSYHILVKVEVDGIRGNMIIDTGASISVIDRNVFSEKMDNQSGVKIQSGSVTGQIHDIHLVKIDCFKIGNRQMNNIRFAGIDLDYVNNMYGKSLNREVIGLLGCDFFVHNGAVIDYNERILFFNIRHSAHGGRRKSK